MERGCLSVAILHYLLLTLLNIVYDFGGIIWNEIILKADSECGINDNELYKALEKAIGDCRAGLKKVLLLPPDFTRCHSGAGKITAMYYEMLKDTCKVDIMPALGTHEPMSRAGVYCHFSVKTCLMNALLPITGVTMWLKSAKCPENYVSSVSEGLDYPNLSMLKSIDFCWINPMT